MPGSGTVADPGFVGDHARQRCDQDRARLGLPPRVDDRAAAAADAVVVPHPGLGVDRLADRAEQAQAGEVVALEVAVAGAHERADRGRRRVVDRDLVLLHDLPVAAPRRVLGSALVDHARRVVLQRPVDDVGVPGHPADVGGAPVDVVVADVEHELVGDLGAEQVAGGRVQDPLRLGGRARGVEQEEHVLGVHALGLAPVVRPPARGRGTSGRGPRPSRPRARCGARRARARSTGSRPARRRRPA